MLTLKISTSLKIGTDSAVFNAKTPSLLMGAKSVKLKIHQENKKRRKKIKQAWELNLWIWFQGRGDG